MGLYHDMRLTQSRRMYCILISRRGRPVRTILRCGVAEKCRDAIFCVSLHAREDAKFHVLSYAEEDAKYCVSTKARTLPLSEVRSQRTRYVSFLARDGLMRITWRS